MIDKFVGDYAFLSNFWPSPVEMDGIIYSTVEHAYQAAKTVSWIERGNVARCTTPGQAKRAGKKVTIRLNWEQIKASVMLELLSKKFHPGTELFGKLKATAPRELVEENNWGDTYWGICNGYGQNILGRQLMYLRDRDWSNGG